MSLQGELGQHEAARRALATITAHIEKVDNPNMKSAATTAYAAAKRRHDDAVGADPSVDAELGFAQKMK